MYGILHTSNEAWYQPVHVHDMSPWKKKMVQEDATFVYLTVFACICLCAQMDTSVGCIYLEKKSVETVNINIS